MRMVRRAIARIVLVPLGLLLAMAMVMAVLATLGLERLTQAVQSQHGGSDASDVLWAIFVHGGAVLKLLSAATIVPALLLILLGELARIRSAIYYVLGGGLALAVIPALARVQGEVASVVPPVAVWQVFATAGFAGGFVYWLIAGRSA